MFFVVELFNTLFFKDDDTGSRLFISKIQHQAKAERLAYVSDLSEQLGQEA